MGTIEKRGKNSWRIGTQVQTENGWEWVRDTIHFPGSMTEAKQRKEAEKALARLIVDVEEGRAKPTSAKSYTVATFAEYWMEQHVKPNLAANTYKNYRHFLDARILPMLGNVPLKKLTPTMLTEWVNQVRESPRRTTALPDKKLAHPRRPSEEARRAKAKPKDAPLSPRTVRHYYDTMDAMLDKAVQWDILRKNPMEKVDRPAAKKARVHYLTEERAVELLRCLHDEPNMCYRAAVLLALLCGLRLGEVGALRLSDVDWEHGTIDIGHALKYTPETGNFEGDPKTEAGERLISLPTGMMAVLHETRAYQEDAAATVGDVWVGEGWIVHAWNGAQLHHDTPSKWFRRFADATALKGCASTICATRMPPYCWRITLTPWPWPRAWATPTPALRCEYTPTRCAAAMKMQHRQRKACLIAPSWGKNWGIKKNSGAPFPARRQRSAPMRDAFFPPQLPQFSPNSLIARWKSRFFDAL